MDEKLPGINNPGQRIQITEDDLERKSAKSTVTPHPPPTAATKPSGPALPAVAGAKAPAAQATPTNGSYCSGCGSAIHPQAVVCPRCGVPTVSAAQATGAAMNVALNSKSTGLAILLSLVFTGAGHWYVGRIGRGVAFFAAAFISGVLILAAVGLFILPIIWVWAAIDANKCAQTHNRLLLESAGTQARPAGLIG